MTPARETWGRGVIWCCSAQGRPLMAGDNVTVDYPSQREQGSTIRRYIIWCSNHAYDECLRRIVERPNVVSPGH